VGIIKSQKITAKAQILREKLEWEKSRRGREIPLYQWRLQLEVLWCTRVSEYNGSSSSALEGIYYLYRQNPLDKVAEFSSV